MSTPVVLGKHLLKEFRIETKAESKTLSIFHGNILEDESDIIGISIYERDENKGDLYKAFREKQLDKSHFTPERKLMMDGFNGWTGVSTSIDRQRRVIYIHSESKEGDVIQIETLRSILKMTFASLSSYIYEGNEIHTVALPIIFRQGIESSDYSSYISVFIYESTKFLRKNTKVKALSLYIWQSSDASYWLNMLQEDLQISIDKEVDAETITSLKQEIVTKIMEPCYSSLVEEWFLRKVKEQLTKPSLDKWSLANLGNILINVIVNALCELPIMPDELKRNGIFKRILEIKSQRLLVEWLADYLLAIKSFKTYVKDNNPSNIEEYQYLLMITQVLKYCEPLLQEEK